MDIFLFHFARGLHSSYFIRHSSLMTEFGLAGGDLAYIYSACDTAHYSVKSLFSVALSFCPYSALRRTLCKGPSIGICSGPIKRGGVPYFWGVSKKSLLGHSYKSLNISVESSAQFQLIGTLFVQIGRKGGESGMPAGQSHACTGLGLGVCEAKAACAQLITCKIEQDAKRITEEMKAICGHSR